MELQACGSVRSSEIKTEVRLECATKFCCALAWSYLKLEPYNCLSKINEASEFLEFSIVIKGC